MNSDRSTPSPSTSTSGTMEDMFNQAIQRGEAMFRERWGKLEEKVRESPTAAVLIAAGIGYCIHRLPVRSLLATQLKLLWALAPPAVVAAAAGKAYQVLDERLHRENGMAPQVRRQPSSGAAAGV